MTRPEHDDLERLAADSSWMHLLARRLVFNADVADDVVQDAWLAALEQRGRAHGGVAAWMSGVIRNLAASHHRREERRQRREATAGPPDAGEETAALVARVDRQRQLAERVLALREPYRRVLLLRFYEGLSQREIAARLRLPPATVNSQLTRALALLREQLDRDHDGNRAAWMTAFAPLGLPKSTLGALLTGACLVKTPTMIAAAAAVLLALSGAWAVSVQEDPPAVRASPTVAAALPEPSVAPGAPAVEAPPGPADPSLEPVREPPLPPLQGRVVRVVQGNDRTPVSGADVYALESTTWSDPEYQRAALLASLGLADPLLPVTRFGQHARTGSDGRAVIAASQEASLVARWSDWIGAVEVGSSHEEIVLRRRAVDVTVVHADGRPAGGIPVALVLFHKDGSDPGVNLSLALTDGTGRVRLDLARFHALFETFPDPPFVAVATPLPEPVRAALAKQGDPAPITLRLPPVGRVEVEVLGRDGAPAPDGTLIALKAAAKQVAWHHQAGALTRAGVAAFEGVGLGLDLAAGAIHAADQPPETLALRSPEAPGETRRVTLRLAAGMLSIRGRLVDAAGVARGGVHLFLSDGREHHGSAVTAADGSFEIRSVRLPDRALAAEVFLMEDDLGAGRLHLDGILVEAGRGTDLGEVVLPRRARARGVVVDATGRPQPDVWLSLVHRGDAGDAEWVGIGAFAGRSDAQGRFEVTLEDPQPDVFIGARTSFQSADFDCEPIPFAARDDLRIVLPPQAAFAGRLLLDPEIPARRLHVALWPERRGAAPSMTVMGWIALAVAEDGALRSSPLEPGTYTLAVAAGMNDPDPALVSGIVAGPGAPAREPRVDPLDLRGRYRVLDLDVRDEDGRPVKAAAFAWPEQGGNLTLGNTTKPLVLARAFPLSTVVVCAADRSLFPAILGPVEGRHDVVLKRGIAVQVRWPEHEPLPNEPFSVVASLEPDAADAGDRLARWMRAYGPARQYLSGPAPLTLRVPAPGSYRLRVTLERDDGGVYRDQPLLAPDAEPMIHVDDGGTTPVVAIPVTPTAVRDAIGRMGGS